MVVNVEQLQAQVDFLEGKVKQLTDVLSLYTVNGLDDAFDGTGNQTFGGGTMRLDKYGIQIVASTTKGALYFVPAFQADPSASAAQAKLQGNSFNNSIGLFSRNSGQTLSSLAYTTPGGFQAQANDLNALTQTAILVSVGRIDMSSVTDAVSSLQIPTSTTDPASPLDGDEWFRTDIYRYRARANGITRNFTLDGTGTTLTIATGAVTTTTSFHAIDTEAAAATDDLDTINGGQTGQVLYIHAANGARDVVAKDGTGNLKLAGDFTMNNTEDTLTLIFDGTNWLELCRSDNGA
jgi:hypothetical protein